MAGVTKTKKAECLNPNTGSRMNIDKDTYDLFSNAIRQVLNKRGKVTFTELVESLYEDFEKREIKFNGSVEWYAITVKKDLEARRVIEVVKEKGRTLNRLLK